MSSSSSSSSDSDSSDSDSSSSSSSSSASTPQVIAKQNESKNISSPPNSQSDDGSSLHNDNITRNNINMTAKGHINNDNNSDESIPSNARRRKRKRSSSSSDTNSNNSDEDIDSLKSIQGSNNNNSNIQQEEVSTNVPSSIDIAILSSKSGDNNMMVDSDDEERISKHEDTSLDKSLDNIDNEDGIINPSTDKSDNNTLIQHTKLSASTNQIQNVQYQMLGTPTLLYRHSSSYLSPSTHSSILTPNQLQMALYMNQFPMKRWFTTTTNGISGRKKRRYTTQTPQSPFINNTLIPINSKPWGRNHDLDMRHTTTSTNTNSNRRRTIQHEQHNQIQLDVEDIVNGLYVASRNRVQSFWNGEGDNDAQQHHQKRSASVVQSICQQEEDEQKDTTPKKSNVRKQSQPPPTQLPAQSATTQPPHVKQKKKLTTPFNLFCKQYISKQKYKHHGIKIHYEQAIKEWKEMNEQEKKVYVLEAERLNCDIDKGDDSDRKKKAASEGEGDDEQPIGSSHEYCFQERRLYGRHYKLISPSQNFNSLKQDDNNKSSSRLDMKDATNNKKSKGKGTKSISKATATTATGTKKDKVTVKGKKSNRGRVKGEGKGKTTGFNIFRSEYLSSIPPPPPTSTAKNDTTNTADIVSTMKNGKPTKSHNVQFVTNTKLAGSKWKSMSEEEKAPYKEKARLRNEKLVSTTRTTANPSIETPSSSTNKKKKKAPTRYTKKDKKSYKGFNLFLKESWITIKKNEPYTGSNKVQQDAYTKKHSELISINWKNMSEEEKLPYKLDAQRRNELVLGFNKDDVSTTDDLTEGTPVTTNNNIGYQSEVNSNGKDVTAAQKDVLHKCKVKKKTGFDVYREETWVCIKQTDPLNIKDATIEDKKTYVTKHREQIRSNWKAMSEINKRPYKLEAMRQNELSSPEYFTPFTRQDVGFGFGLEDDHLEDSLTARDGPSQSIDLHHGRNGVGGPSGHGNCLLTIPCRCRSCKLLPSWFLVHPTGDNLSSLAISKMILPRDSLGGVAQQERLEVDVGSRILQISQCGSSVQHLSTNQTICLVARTSQYCSVIYAKVITEGTITNEDCSMKFQLQGETRIDLRTSRMSSQPSYLPIHVSCDPKTTISYFTFPSFAILSRNDMGNCTTIHRVSLKDEPVITTHNLSSFLADISLIEYSSTDRMVVWAAARSVVMPKLTTGFFKKRSGTVAGYGHSLHRIDLRSNSSSKVWSPSHAEYMTEGLHSINGIMTDRAKEHIVWVSSTSACKVWAIDIRYKSAKAVVSWTLPSLCDDIGVQMPITGPFGAGILMSQPPAKDDDVKVDNVEQSNEQIPVLFTVKKDPNSHSVGVYQFPTTMPRFHTMPIESSGFQELPRTKYGTSSIARSTIFPLPDVSESIFNTGVAVLQCSSKTCLDDAQLQELGYQSTPTNVTFVITMTSLGDMYCHSLLETNAMEKTPESLQQELSDGLPVGTNAIPVPDREESAPLHPNCLSITLSNEFPTPSSAITSSVILDKQDCCRFKSYYIDDIMNGKRQPNKARKRNRSSKKLNAPQSMYELSKRMRCKSLNDATVDTFRVASAAIEEGDIDTSNKQAHIEHPQSQFGVLLPSEEYDDETSIAQKDLTLPSSHVIVAKKKEKNDVVQNDLDYIFGTNNGLYNRPNIEMNESLLKTLQDNYYYEKKQDDQQDGIKREWSSDSD